MNDELDFLETLNSVSDNQVEKTINKNDVPSLEPVKDSLRKKRKNDKKMRTGTFYYCDSCGQPIYNKKEGYIVHGNIYVADPECRGGLIGQHFPNVKPGDKIEVTDVQEAAFCKTCLKQALDL